MSQGPSTGPGPPQHVWSRKHTQGGQASNRLCQCRGGAGRCRLSCGVPVPVPGASGDRTRSPGEGKGQVDPRAPTTPRPIETEPFQPLSGFFLGRKGTPFQTPGPALPCRVQAPFLPGPVSTCPQPRSPRGKEKGLAWK